MAQGPAPSDLFYNRRLRGELPALKVHVNKDELVEERQRSREKYLSTGTRKPARGQFSVGEKVLVQDAVSKLWAIQATVESIRDSGRSYWVITPEGSAYLRNRKFLKKCADEGMHEEAGMKANGDKSAECMSESAAEKPAPRRSMRIQLQSGSPARTSSSEPPAKRVRFLTK